MLEHHLVQKVTLSAALCAVAFSGDAQQGGAASSVFHPALEQAIESCLALPDGKEQILAVLTKSGWLESKEVVSQYSPYSPLVMMMASTFFARQRSTDDPKTFSYSAMNALFMGGSILGNSALSQQPQPLLQSEGVWLSVIGIGLAAPGQPYCLFGGPVELKDTLVDRFDFVPKKFDVGRQPQYGDGHEYLSADADGNSVALFFFDQPKTLEDIRALGPITSDVGPADFDYGGLVARFFPVTLLINSSLQ